MKNIQSTLVSAMLALAAGWSVPSLAQATAAVVAAPDAAPMAEAEVRKVDKENRKITLKHGEIKNLDMPAMTMVFEVADPALLGNLKKGDKVKFAAIDEGGGRLKVTALQPLK